ERVAHLDGVLRDAVVLAGEEVHAPDLALVGVERFGDVAAPVLLARSEDEPLGPGRLVLEADLHRDEGALAEADEDVPAAGDATLVLCTQCLDGPVDDLLRRARVGPGPAPV